MNLLPFQEGLWSLELIISNESKGRHFLWILRICGSIGVCLRQRVVSDVDFAIQTLPFRTERSSKSPKILNVCGSAHLGNKCFYSSSTECTLSYVLEKFY
jgi:hypothetical protein